MKRSQNCTQFPDEGSWRAAEGETELAELEKSPQRSELGFDWTTVLELLLSNSNKQPVSAPPVGCTELWLEEGGGAIFPPGGGGRSPKPPELWGRGLSLFLPCPIFSVMVCPSLKPRSSLGPESTAWEFLLISNSCFTHLKWSCRATLKSNESPLSPNPTPMNALRPEDQT